MIKLLSFYLTLMKKILVIAIAFLISLNANSQNDYNKIENIQIKSMNGSTLSTYDLFKSDKPLVIFSFYNTGTCSLPPPSHLLDTLMKYSAKIYELGADIIVLGITYSDDINKDENHAILNCLKSKYCKFDFYWITNKNNMAFFSSPMYPMTFIVNSGKEIVDRKSGAILDIDVFLDSIRKAAIR